MSQKAVNAYKRENPGSKLQTAVTEKKPTGKEQNVALHSVPDLKGRKICIISIAPKLQIRK